MRGGRKGIENEFSIGFCGDGGDRLIHFETL